MHDLQGGHHSLWMATTGSGDRAPLDGDDEADVVVVGAGIAGLTTARLLVAEGARVIVVDAGPICAGATGNTTAKVTSLHGLFFRALADRFDIDRARLYGEANQAAIAEIARVVAADRIDCGFETRDHTVYTVDPAVAEQVDAEAELAAELGLPVAGPGPDELPFDVAATLRFAGQAQFHPRAYCLGLADAVEAAGGRIFTQTRALGLERKEHAVVTERGRLRAPSIVLATHLPINELGGYFARTEASRSYALAVTVAGARPKGMYLGLDEPTRSLRTAGDHLIVGGEGHKVGADHDTNVHYANLETWAREHFDVNAVDYRWSAQDWTSADGLPYIGRAAGAGDGVYVATAFRKWGMTHGTLSGMLLRDLIVGHENPWLEVFDATRLAPRQSLRRVLSANVDVAKHFIGDRLRVDGSLDALEPGDGAVIRVEGKAVAAFRDEDGAVAAVSAVCTHLGCLVSFNPAERTWDCPCHGSRFGLDGTVLEGPATADLAVHEMGGGHRD